MRLAQISTLAQVGARPTGVAYVGSTSKTLAPGLRSAGMALPAQLVGPRRVVEGLADAGSSVMDQIAFAKLLASAHTTPALCQMRRRDLTRRTRR